MAGTMTESYTNGLQTDHYNREQELKALDDTKGGVKALVDAGINKVPRIFVRSPDELSDDSKTKKATLQVPVIDLAGIDSKDRRDEIVKEMVDASYKWGFFQVVNHGIPLDLLDNIMEGIRKFHEQDIEVKKEYYTRELTKQVVYHTNFDLYTSKAANWKDTLTVNTAFGGHLDPQLLPPICKDVILDYTNHVNKLGEVLFQLLSLGLGMKPDSLKDMECDKGWSCVLHYYPPCPEPQLTLGNGKHSDPSFLTVLLQDQIGGLQVLHQNQWVDVQPLPGALVINIGDMLQMIANEKLKSVYHRVKANYIGPRVSIALFFSGLVSSPKVYGPMKELISEENPALFKDFTTSDFLSNFLSRPLGESGLDRFKI